jgi:perosamine synthetase
MTVFVEAFKKQSRFFSNLESQLQSYLCSIESSDDLIVRPLSKTLFEVNSYAFQDIHKQLSDSISADEFREIFFTAELKSGKKLSDFLLYLNEHSEVTLTTKSATLKSHDLNKLISYLSKWCREIIGVTPVLFYFDKESLTRVNRFTDPLLDSPGKTMILTAGPSISALECSYAYDAAKYGWNGSWSKYLSRFEEEFAEYIGADYALATSSCTGALQIALMSLDIGPGDEVIVPDETWVATANAVRFVDAIPIFADIEIDSWNIDAKSVENLITSKTKAIMPVHMYGHPARMDAIVDLAKKYDLHIIEDAAPAIGAEWKGQRCGTFGDFAAFSFQGAKLLVTGEGGMLVTSNKDLYEKAKKIWDQGRNPNKAFWIDADGVKFKMSNVQAALGLGQIQRADELIEMKRRIFSWYEEGLGDISGIHLNKEVEGGRSIYWMSSIYLDQSLDISREYLIDSLRKQNVDTRPVFPAISQYPIWSRKQEPQPRALLVGQRAMNLPSGVCLRKDHVMYVCEKIREILGK